MISSSHRLLIKLEKLPTGQQDKDDGLGHEASKERGTYKFSLY